MAALQNVVLTDRAATPVNHTFTPLKLSNGVATLTESSGTPIADPTLTLSNTLSKGKYKVRAVLRIPVVQTQVINGISTPVVVREQVWDLTAKMDKTSLLQERKDGAGMFYSLLGSSQTFPMSLFQNLEGIY